MLEMHLVRQIIKDILETEEYTLEGIARYTNTPKDVIEEIYLAINTNPSALFLRRLMELHRKIRNNFYVALIKKLIHQVNTP